jgi:hypothetical protein
MKKLIFLFAFLAGFYLAYADGNPTVPSNNVTFSTYVITPFNVWNVQTTDDLPDVIQGQTRHWAPGSEVLAVFEMVKEANYTVNLHLAFDAVTVLGVTIGADWHFHDTPPPWQGDFPIMYTDYIWYDTQNQGWVDLSLNSLAATGTATLGNRTFTIHISGYYAGM